MRRMDVTPIVVTYNSADVVDFLSETLDDFENPIVVDNGSVDDTLNRVRILSPHARIVESSRNIGFGAANNLGATFVETDYVLLINPDCHIDNDSLDCLIKAASIFTKAAIVAPQVYFKNGSPQESFRQAYYEHVHANYAVPDAVCSAKWLIGCCMLVRMDAYRKLGGFDEQFFLYYEEDDLCLRALRAGYDCIIEPRAKAMHIGGYSSGASFKVSVFKHYHYARSRYLITRKYQSKWLALRYRLIIAVVAPAAVIMFSLSNKKSRMLQWMGWGKFAWKFWANLRV